MRVSPLSTSLARLAAGLLAGCVLTFGLLPEARADRASAARAAPVIARILLYERTLAGRAGGDIEIVVFHAGTPASVAEATALEQAFRSMGALEVQGIPVRLRVLRYAAATARDAIAGGADVLVLAAGLESSVGAIGEIARRRRILTIGTTREFAENGTLLAIFTEAERPRIAVNMEAVRASGTQLSAQLLRLCLVL